MWTCTICLLFTCTTLRLLLSHIYMQHSQEPGFNVRCGVNGCPRTYNKYNSFYRHLHREHIESLQQTTNQNQGQEDGNLNLDDVNPNPIDTDMLHNDNNHEVENATDSVSEPEDQNEVYTWVTVWFSFESSANGFVHTCLPYYFVARWVYQP